MIAIPKQERLRLLKFVCSFAWTDLRITETERDVIRQLVTAHKLDADERNQVEEWLELPPAAAEVDPLEIPREHRDRFVESARLIIVADGQLAPVESEALRIFEELLAD